MMVTKYVTEFMGQSTKRIYPISREVQSARKASRSLR